MAGNMVANNGPKLRTDFQYQTEPKRQWTVIKEFGSKGGGCNGGIAIVEVMNDPYDRHYIQKQFKPEHVRWELAHKEIALLHQLADHPGIVKMVDHFIDETKQKASVYLEYCNGGDLEAIIKNSNQNNRVHERKIWKWLISLFDTLVYCHRGPTPEDNKAVLLYWNFIYHRDIKPGNIFLKTDKEKGEIVAKLADFGCSESAHWTFLTKTEQTASKTDAYTPGFEPPEHPEYTGATDVWQLALCIACVCSSIVNPWSKENPRGKKWSRSQPAGPYYSKELNDILSWCLTDNRKKRPTPLEISKRLKEKFEKVKNKLPLDNQPMQALPHTKRQPLQILHTVSSPGPGPGKRMKFPMQRPGFPGHAFSDPELDRMEHWSHGGNRYLEHVLNQRSPIPPHVEQELIQRQLEGMMGPPHSHSSPFGPRGPSPGFGRGKPFLPFGPGGFHHDSRSFSGRRV